MDWNAIWNHWIIENFLVGYCSIGIFYTKTADFYSEIIENTTVGEQETSVLFY